MSTQSAMKDFLEQVAYRMRVHAIKMTTRAGSGHPTSALSSADIVAALFFYGMGYDPLNPYHPENDRFILSKGHASPILYAAWREKGVLTDQDLAGYRSMNSVLEGHPTLRFDRSEAATGSLGTGLSIGAGMALYAKMFKRAFLSYVLLGDSELTEGSVWEAAEIGAVYKLNNLIAIVDVNRLGQSTETIHGHHLQRYVAKFEAFGWHSLVIDGHNMQQIMHALDQAQATKDKPTVIIAKTIKGYGVDRVANKEGFHGKVFNSDEIFEILAIMKQKFLQAAMSNAVYTSMGRYKAWHAKYNKRINERKDADCNQQNIIIPSYELGELIATRKAYGEALVAIAKECVNIVSLDAEVKNSTYAELFEKQFPHRFVQCFIAEQNMVSMGVGFQRRGAVPFISTFGAFFSRAFDQIRMAAISTSALRLVGSHAGVSVGQDGPSQMALEDIALMRTLPGSIVLYPSDAVSTFKLIACMAKYNQGISYMRTTRMATPVIYDNTSSFSIGGSNIIKQSERDIACVIGAGVTLFEALKAYEILQKQGVDISVIDLYSIKPLDRDTIVKVVHRSGKRLVTVEDHYVQGGIGQAVTYAVRNEGFTISCLAVTKLPRSGTPQELLAYTEIDAHAIVNAILY